MSTAAIAGIATFAATALICLVLVPLVAKSYESSHGGKMKKPDTPALGGARRPSGPVEAATGAEYLGDTTTTTTTIGHFYPNKAF